MWIIFLVIGGLLLLAFAYSVITSYKKDNPNNRLSVVESKYSTDMNRWAAKTETKASTARGALITSLTSEVTSLKLHEDAQRDHEYAGRAKTIEQEQKETQHLTLLKREENSRIVIDNASSIGLTPLTYEQLIMEREKIKFEFQRKQIFDQLEYDKTRQLAELELEMGHKVELAPFQELELIRGRLDQLYLESETVWKSDLPDTLKARRIELLEKTITFLETTYYGKQRLLQAANGQEVEGAHQETKAGGDSGKEIPTASE